VDEAREMDLEAFSGQDDIPATLCDEAFLAAGFEFADDEPLPTFYVDASSPAGAAADGTRAAPFRALTDALNLAFIEGPHTVLVAAGNYEEKLNFAPGMRVFGGYDAETWTLSEDPTHVSRVGEVSFGGTEDATRISLLSHFEVEGAITIGPYARVILRNNVLNPALRPVEVTPDHPDPFVVSAVYAGQASLLAQGNQVRLPSEDPGQVFSTAFNLDGSCARIVSNDIESYRVALRASESEVAYNFNFVADGMNGVMFFDSVGFAAGNYFHLVGSPAGCTYAAYLAGSQPVLRHNEFHLNGRGSGGINESTIDSDPLELVGNEFYLHSSTMLYFDRQVDGEADVTPWLYEIDEVNALPDITLVSGNVASYQ
jgi:hypothetical protein